MLEFNEEFQGDAAETGGRLFGLGWLYSLVVFLVLSTMLPWLAPLLYSLRDHILQQHFHYCLLVWLYPLYTFFVLLGGHLLRHRWQGFLFSIFLCSPILWFTGLMYFWLYKLGPG